MGYVLQINLLQLEHQEVPLPTTPKEISDLLQEFEDIFVDSSNLPPHRTCDHAIILKPDSKPPNQRPYRVPHK
jgi:hypothetical protein